MQKIVDCHCHVYPDKIAAKASESIGRFYSAPMRYDGRVETVKELIKKSGLTKCIIFSVATKPSQTRSINEFIAGTVAADPDIFTGLGTVHPDSEDIRGDIDHLVSLGLKGVKLHADIQQFKTDDYRCLKIYDICEKKGLPVLMHCGDNRFDFSNPNRIKPILDIYKNLTVIGAHLGGYTVWEDARRELSGYDNFYVDCSSSLFAFSPEEGKALIEAYGADKVLFGTDFPMWDPSDELERLYALGLGEDELDNILYKNANRIFDLGL